MASQKSDEVVGLLTCFSSLVQGVTEDRFALSEHDAVHCAHLIFG